MVKSSKGLFFLACLGACACGGEDDPGDPGEQRESIEIEGTWTSNFGSTEVIDDESWSSESDTFSSLAEIVEFSNVENAAVTRDPEIADGDPGAYSRIVWTEIEGDSFYNCIVAFSKDSVEAAENESEPADATNPDVEGCGSGNFSWTKLIR